MYLDFVYLKVYTEACHITNHNVHRNNVTLQWDNCGTNPPNGLLYGYEITATDQSTKQTTSITLESAYLNTTIVNLTCSTTYSFVIKVLTFEGVGKPSLPENITTRDRGKLLDVMSCEETTLLLSVHVVIREGPFDI